MIIQVALALGFALLAEAGLSFLGIGAEPPTPSWGDMLNEAYQFIFQAPLALVFPGLAIMLSVLSFNVVADGLRDAIGAGSATSAGRGVRTRLRERRAARNTAPGPGAGAVPEGRVPVDTTPSPVSPSNGHAPGVTVASGGSHPSHLLDVEGLRVEFAIGGGSWPVVEDLSFSVEPGRTLGLVGESGSGKTDLHGGDGPAPPGGPGPGGRPACRPEAPRTGPQEPNGARRQIAMIFQDPMTASQPGLHRRRADRRACGCTGP